MAERTATVLTTPGVNAPEVEARALAYDPNFDVLAYRHLKNLGDSLPPAEFSRLANQLEVRTRHNLETMLGERFNTELSQVAYRLIDGHLVSAEHDEPFIEVMRRGQEYRRQFGSPHDHAREAAEILGFERIQQILIHLRGESAWKMEKAKIILISPRGTADSDYQHNFFDVYEVGSPTFETTHLRGFGRESFDPELKTEGLSRIGEMSPHLEGVSTTHIRMSRYTSRLSYHQFHDAAQKLDPAIPTPIKLTDEFFLAHPMVTEKELEEILAAFHPQEETMPLAKYQDLLASCRPLIDHYLATLQSTFDSAHLRGFGRERFDRPEWLTTEGLSRIGEMSPHLEGVTTQEVLQTYYALLNFADEWTGLSTPHTAHPRGGIRAASGLLPGGVHLGGVKYLLGRYGSLPVRAVMTGCGRQEGLTSLPALGLRPFSVADFARLFKTDDEDEDASDFQCPGVKEDGTKCTYIVRYGNGIRKCPECGEEATCG